VSYQDDVARLARALADLLTADRTAPVPLPADQVHAALVCRDTVVGAVRELTGALLRPTSPPVRAAPDLLIRSPAHALHAALQDLPALAGGDLSLSQALADAGTGPVARWQRAARAAVALERHHDSAAALPGPDAWSLARDLAALSSAVTVLDADLASTVDTAASNTAAGATASSNTAAGPPAAAASPDVAAALVDKPAHALLQLAAAELAAHTADVPFAAANLPDRPPRPVQPVQPVRRLADLPAANRQLAELLRSRGSSVTVVDVRAALRAVTYGVDLTAQALTAEHTPAVPAGTGGPGQAQQRQPADRGRAVEQLQQALPDLQLVLHSPLATLTPPAPSVRALGQQIRTRLSAAGRLHEELHARSATGAPREALSQALAAWAVTAAPVVEAACDGLRAAAASQALLAPRQDPTPERYAGLLWLPLTAADPNGQQTLEAAGRAAAALHAAAAPLAALLGSAAEVPSSGTRRAAADASAAFSELTAALQSRPALRNPNPARTAHPSQPGDASRRQLHRR